jgi:cytochrome c oxidase subunit 1
MFVNMLYSTKRGPIAGPDPWDGRSLEWSIPSPPPAYNFAQTPVVENRDDWWHRKYTEDSEGRLVRLPSGGADADAETAGAVATTPSGGVATAGDHDDGHGIHMPSPSFFPFVVAAGLPFLGYAAVFQNIYLLIPGLVLLLFGVYAWGLEPGTES